LAAIVLGGPRQCKLEGGMRPQRAVRPGAHHRPRPGAGQRHAPNRHPALHHVHQPVARRLLLLATGESSFPAGRFSALYVLEQTAAGAMFVRAEVLRFGPGAR
jgi:hypothetical protein